LRACPARPTAEKLLSAKARCQLQHQKSGTSRSTRADDVRLIFLCRHVLLLADVQLPAAVMEPLAQVHKPVDGVNCHRSLSVPSAPAESMP